MKRYPKAFFDALRTLEKEGLITRIETPPSPEYKAPAFTADFYKCVECGRPRSLGSGQRCKPCYTKNTNKTLMASKWRVTIGKNV